MTILMRHTSVKIQPLILGKLDLRIKSHSVTPYSGPIIRSRSGFPSILPEIVCQRPRQFIECILIVDLDSDSRTILEILPHPGIGRMHIVCAVVTVAVGLQIIVRCVVEHTIALIPALCMHIAAESALRTGLSRDTRLLLVVTRIGSDVHYPRDSAVAIQYRTRPVNHLDPLHVAQRYACKVRSTHVNIIEFLAIQHDFDTSKCIVSESTHRD